MGLASPSGRKRLPKESNQPWINLTIEALYVSLFRVYTSLEVKRQEEEENKKIDTVATAV